MVHPPIALERLRYRPQTGQVIYYGRQRHRCGDAEASPARIFPALDFLAALCTHVPDPGQQLVRYYGNFTWKLHLVIMSWLLCPRALTCPAAVRDTITTDTITRCSLSSTP